MLIVDVCHLSEHGWLGSIQEEHATSIGNYDDQTRDGDHPTESNGFDQIEIVKDHVSSGILHATSQQSLNDPVRIPVVEFSETNNSERHGPIIKKTYIPPATTNG